MLKSQSAKKKVNGTNAVNGASANKNAIQSSSIASKKRPAEVSKALTPVKQLVPTKKQKLAPKPESEEEEEEEEELEDDEENDVNHGVELHDDEDEDIDDDDVDDDEGEEFDEDEDEDDENDSEQDAADAEMVDQLKAIQKKQPTTAVPKKADLSAKAASSSTATSSSSSNSTVTPVSNSSSTDDSAEPDHSDVTFQSLGVTESLCEACLTLGWKKPSDIQRESLPYALAGRDIIGLAETGSGKTGAFGLPILQKLLEKPQGLFALILSPTRELAFQISEQLEALGSGIGVRAVTIVGGVDMMSQAIALSKKPHIIVASPGRIVDHLENTKGFNLRNLKYLVLDEADRLLNMDFEKEIDQILQVIPKERNTFLFSATMTSKVAKLQRASLHNPVKVEVSKKYQTVKKLIQQYLFIPAKFKDVYLIALLNELSGNTTIIFTSTCEHCQRLAIMLRNLGFGAIPLHGKMSQPKRLGALTTFKTGKRNILIATDVASRGLDIPAVDLVLNYDIPTHSKDYIHRVGRTARAGRSGRAVTFVTQYDVELFQRIEQLLGKKMDAFQMEESQVMMLLERVSEAQRIAAMELRESDALRRSKKKGDDEYDEETESGNQQITAGLGGIKAKSGAGGKSGARGGGRGGRGGGRGRGRR